MQINFNILVFYLIFFNLATIKPADNSKRKTLTARDNPEYVKDVLLKLQIPDSLAQLITEYVKYCPYETLNLFLAILRENFEMAQDSIQNANVNFFHKLEFDQYTTVLIESAKKNNVNLVKLVVEYGADVNSQETENGNCALYYAVKNNNLEMVKFLTKNNAKVFLKNNKGESAIDLSQKANSDIRLFFKRFEEDSFLLSDRSFSSGNF